MLPVRRLAQAGLMVGRRRGADGALRRRRGAAGGRARPVYAKDAPLIRVVQANIDQKDKWKPENLDAGLLRL